MRDKMKSVMVIVIVAFVALGFLYWMYNETKPFRKPMIDEVIVEKVIVFTAILFDDVKAKVAISIKDPILNLTDFLRMKKGITELLYSYSSDEIVSSSIAIIEKLRPIRDRSTMSELTFNISFTPENGELFILEF